MLPTDFGRMPPTPGAIYSLIMAIPAAAGYLGRMAAEPLRGPAVRPDEVRRVRRTPRDWIVDVLLFALAVGFTMITLIDGVERGVAAAPLAIDAALGMLGSLGVWLRRRWPVGFAVSVGLFSVYSTAASAVALIAVFTVAAYRRFAVAGPVAAGCALGAVLAPMVRPDASGPIAAQILLGVVCVAAVLAWGMYVRARRQLVQSLRERALRAELDQELRLAQARQLERSLIAREMHDVLAHRISLLSLHAGALELHPDAPTADIAHAAAVIREAAHDALEDLRHIVGVLRADGADGQRAEDPPQRPQLSLVDLPGLVDQSRQAGMWVVLDYTGTDLAAVPATNGRAAYRIVQEGLTNARKHAPDAEISVVVRGAPGDALTVEIRNPCPTDPPGTPIPGAGTGLIGLAERAGLAGGRLEHGRTSTGDFRLYAWLPWPV
jgi:signal transduction histidine kinase